jgi:NADPH2:quinone reductase
VAWVYAPGNYADRIVIAATALVPLPDAIDDRTPAAVMMQWLTTSHFATHLYAVQPGDVALVRSLASLLLLLYLLILGR